MWADVEAMCKTYLDNAGLGVPVGTVIPTDVERFVRLQLGGSQRRTLVHRDSLVTVECWSVGEQDAAHLAELVYHVLDEWELVPAFDGWRSGPYPQPDPETGISRYVMTVIIRHRMEESV
ncbi:MAG: hypothetical protein FWG47_05005 [Propionibacteriaceae bacterium]|nr:hypothetical protein [Propionibacteriaceae bacterium]